MKKIIPDIVLLLMLASVLVPVGVGYAKGEVKLEVVYVWDDKNQVFTSELDFWSAWSINPCKYIYEGTGLTKVKTTIVNKTGEDAKFDIEGSGIITIPASSSQEYTRWVMLRGQTEKILITKLAEGDGIRVQEALILKIVPK